jgi:hypothetical protein
VDQRATIAEEIRPELVALAAAEMAHGDIMMASLSIETPLREQPIRVVAAAAAEYQETHVRKWRAAPAS